MQNEWNYDKNSKIIVIPEGTKVIPDEAFLDFDKLVEVVIPDSVEQIGGAAFKGCKSLKRVKLPDNLRILYEYAFSECRSLEEINIPSSLHYFSCGVFGHCINLKKIDSHNDIGYIDDYAFYNCQKLEFTIPPHITSVGRMAFTGCNAIKEIHIPKSVDCIECGAFSLMASLEKIVVDKENEKYMSEDDDTVLLSKDGVVLQYAINSPREEFLVGYYMDTLGINEGNDQPIEGAALIYNIGDYAFAGAKHLKKLYMASEVESIGKKTFYGCDNLKELEVFHSHYGNSFLLSFYGALEEESSIPFENIIIGEKIQTLCEGLSDLFKNAKSVSLPLSLEHISGDVFKDSEKLENLVIPENIKMIMPDTFHPELSVTFPVIGTIKGKDFNMLQTKITDNYNINYNDKDTISVFSLNNGSYYVKINEFDTIEVTKEEITKLENDFQGIENEPDIFVTFMIHLLSINAESSHLLQNVWLNPELEALFQKFVNDFEYAQEIAAHKVGKAIKEIMETCNPNMEFLFSSIIMKKLKKIDLIKILENYNESIVRFFRLNNGDIQISIDRLVAYCNLLEKYKVYDRFLYNPAFFQKLSYKNQEFLIKYWNKNIKYLIKNSDTIYDMYGENFNDLLNTCNALGVFSDDERISQRMTMFINEVMFKKDSHNSIRGNNIHTVFGGISPREDIDYEFIKFFIENYDRLVDLERNNSGIIVRIYNDFRNISNTSTSHRGMQRKLKVTIEKCLDYFSEQKFEGINENNKELARLLQQYYSESYVLTIGESIINESKKAPRNIYTMFGYDKDNNAIYDNNPMHDLKEKTCIDNFSYHWLPKQDYDNLILGKYCSCCAHVLGAGAGIMRASMILDNCQNLVIRNKENNIVAKMTLYVNKEEGYAVFNTSEINAAYYDVEARNGIYKAFMRGVKAFIKEYNENNPTMPIVIVTIGEYRNIIKDLLGNIETDVFPTPYYSKYGYKAGKGMVGTHDGDCKKKQLLVYKK